MNRDELSSVLLKLIGFAFVAHAILGLPAPIVSVAYYSVQGSDTLIWGQIIPFVAGAAVRAIGGLLIIAKGPRISEWLFAFGQGASEA